MQIAPIESLNKRWGWGWIPLAVAVLILVCTGLYAWLRPELYRSETRILVEPKTVFDRELSAAETKESVESQVQNLQQMFESRKILERIIQDFELRSRDISIPMEDALKSIRNNLEVSKASENTFTMAYYSTDPQKAQAITKRLADILIQMHQRSWEDKARDKDQFLSEELVKAERELDVINGRVAQFRREHAGERQDSVDLQTFLRDQARLQWQADQISRMKFNAEMAKNFTSRKDSSRLYILDEASLPERPELPERHHILWTGIVLAIMVALPAVFMQRKVPSHSA